MLSLTEAKRIAHGSKLSNGELLCVLLAIEPCEPLKLQTIRERATAVGLTQLLKRDISDLLGKAGKAKGVVARVDSGWELQGPGIEIAQKLADAAGIKLIVTHSSRSLRAHADAIADPLTKSFVYEAIRCFEVHQYRAAVVFSWAGAVALLHSHVFKNKLGEFNAEALRRDSKWKNAKQQDDLGRMKERDFLDVCEVIGVLGKNVKQVLQNECLNLRNGCGHPNSLFIAENSVAAHIEKLIINVFSRF